MKLLTQEQLRSSQGIGVREHPIIFSGESVRAILSGAKTQTRRVIRIHEKWVNARSTREHLESAALNHGSGYGKVGDLLWVRECHSLLERCSEGNCPEVWYWNDQKEITRGDYTKPRSSIHMPRWASRLTLEITGVRVERVQEISEGDAVAEGVPDLRKNPEAYSKPIPEFPNYEAIHKGYFCKLWDSANAKRGYGWDENPWVWVIKFRTIGDRQ